MVKGKPFVVAPKYEGYLDVVWLLFPKCQNGMIGNTTNICYLSRHFGHCVVADFFGHSVVVDPFPL